MANQLYNYQRLARQMAALDLTPPKLAAKAGVSIFSVHAGLAGNLGTMRILRKLADALEVKWESITTLDHQSEIHRAPEGKQKWRVR